MWWWPLIPAKLLKDSYRRDQEKAVDKWMRDHPGIDPPDGMYGKEYHNPYHEEPNQTVHGYPSNEDSGTGCGCGCCLTQTFFEIILVIIFLLIIHWLISTGQAIIDAPGSVY